MVEQAHNNMRWISKTGQVNAETESQRSLERDDGFQMRLSVYRRGYEAYHFTAESQRAALEQEMQRAFESDQNAPSATAGHQFEQ